MPPSVNFGGSAVAGIGSPGLKKPTGSKGSLEMSSEGCGATVLAARDVLGTSRPMAAKTPTTGARTRRAFKIYVPPKSCVLQGGSRRLNHKRRTAHQLALLATPYGRRAALQDPPRAASADGGEVAGRRADALGRVARVKDERARGPAIGRFDVG